MERKGKDEKSQRISERNSVVHVGTLRNVIGVNRKSILGLWLICICLSPFSESLAVERDISGGLSHYIMGVMYDDLGDVDAAVEEYRQALHADKRALMIRLNLATALIRQNNTDAAIAELKKASRYAPDAVEPHAILALIYSSQNNQEKATQEYEFALKNAAKLQPKNAVVYKNLGLIYMQQRKLDQARETFELIVEMQPDDEQLHFILASIYHELKEYDRCEEALKTALELRLDFHQALNFLGYLYVEQSRNLDEAERMIRAALEAEPVNGAYVDSLGWLFYQRGEYRKALVELQKAVLFLEDPVIYDHLGDTHFKLENVDEAIKAWERSLELDPKQKEVKKKIRRNKRRR